MIYTITEIKNRIISIAEEYGVDSMSLFGSYARGEATEDSDVDILIERGNIYNLLEYSSFINKNFIYISHIGGKAHAFGAGCGFKDYESEHCFRYIFK